LPVEFQDHHHMLGPDYRERQTKEIL
jgi:hypothetical protein